jgi:hypothetical protein
LLAALAKNDFIKFIGEYLRFLAAVGTTAKK